MKRGRLTIVGEKADKRLCGCPDQSNPLLHADIVRTIRSFLSAEEINVTRLVCRLWAWLDRPVWLLKGKRPLFEATWLHFCRNSCQNGIRGEVAVNGSASKIEGTIEACLSAPDAWPLGFLRILERYPARQSWLFKSVLLHGRCHLVADYLYQMDALAYTSDQEISGVTMMSWLITRVPFWANWDRIWLSAAHSSDSEMLQYLETTEAEERHPPSYRYWWLSLSNPDMFQRWIDLSVVPTAVPVGNLMNRNALLYWMEHVAFLTQLPHEFVEHAYERNWLDVLDLILDPSSLSYSASSHYTCYQRAWNIFPPLDMSILTTTGQSTYVANAHLSLAHTPVIDVCVLDALLTSRQWMSWFTALGRHVERFKGFYCETGLLLSMKTRVSHPDRWRIIEDKSRG